MCIDGGWDNSPPMEHTSASNGFIYLTVTLDRNAIIDCTIFLSIIEVQNMSFRYLGKFLESSVGPIVNLYC